MVDGVLGQRSAEFKEMLELLPPGAFDGTIELVAPLDLPLLPQFADTTLLL